MTEWEINKLLNDNGYKCTKIYKNRLTYLNEEKNQFVFINTRGIYDKKMLERIICK
jgi:hypothetical protein